MTMAMIVVDTKVIATGEIGKLYQSFITITHIYFINMSFLHFRDEPDDRRRKDDRTSADRQRSREYKDRRDRESRDKDSRNRQRSELIFNYLPSTYECIPIILFKKTCFIKFFHF